jgi:hypothetical protein
MTPVCPLPPFSEEKPVPLAPAREDQPSLELTAQTKVKFTTLIVVAAKDSQHGDTQL